MLLKRLLSLQGKSLNWNGVLPTVVEVRMQQHNYVQSVFSFYIFCQFSRSFWGGGMPVAFWLVWQNRKALIHSNLSGYWLHEFLVQNSRRYISFKLQSKHIFNWHPQHRNQKDGIKPKETLIFEWFNLYTFLYFPGTVMKWH